MLDRVRRDRARGTRASRRTLAAARTAHTAHVELLTAAGAEDACVPVGRRPRSHLRVPAPGRRRRRGPRRGPRPRCRAAPRAEDRLSLLGRRSAFAAQSGAFARVLAEHGRRRRAAGRALADAADGPDDPARGAAADAGRRARRGLRLRALAGRVSSSAEPGPGRAGWRRRTPTHRGRRDQLAAMVRAAGGDPVAADVSYELPNPAARPRSSASGALVTEQRCAEVYATMVGSTVAGDRQWAIDALTDAAVRQLGFGGAPDRSPASPSSDRVESSGQREDPPRPRSCLGRGGSARRKGPREIGLPVSRTARSRRGRRRTSAASACALVRGELVVAGVVAVVHVVVDRVEARQRAGVAARRGSRWWRCSAPGCRSPRRSCSCSRPGTCGRARTSGRPRARRSCPGCSWWPSRPAARSTAPGCRRSPGCFA